MKVDHAGKRLDPGACISGGLIKINPKDLWVAVIYSPAASLLNYTSSDLLKTCTLILTGGDPPLAMIVMVVGLSCSKLTLKKITLKEGTLYSLWKPIHTERNRKRKFPLMFVIFSLIFFTFASAFAWRERAVHISILRSQYNNMCASHKGCENLICCFAVCKTRRCNSEIQSEYPKFNTMTSKLTKSEAKYEKINLCHCGQLGDWIGRSPDFIPSQPAGSFVALTTIHLVDDSKEFEVEASFEILYPFWTECSLRTLTSPCTPIQRFTCLKRGKATKMHWDERVKIWTNIHEFKSDNNSFLKLANSHRY